MNKNTLRWELYETLKNGGAWLGAARTFLVERARNGEHLVWGSSTEVRNLSVADIEDMAKKIAIEAILEDRTQRKTVGTTNADVDYVLQVYKPEGPGPEGRSYVYVDSPTVPGLHCLADTAAHALSRAPEQVERLRLNNAREKS